MDIAELQQRLAKQACYDGKFDGIAGPLTRDGILQYLTDGPDFALEPIDFSTAAASLAVPASYIQALYEVESSGKPFIAGRPVILFEPHRFYRATKGRFPLSDFNYPTWDAKRYPATQAARYEQLINAICLDPMAGFASASYGAFQILGENYARCDVRDPMAFAWQESQTAADQLYHFICFIRSDEVLHRALQRGDWVTVAKRYNGTAYYFHAYDKRLAQAVRRAELKSA